MLLKITSGEVLYYGLCKIIEELDSIFQSQWDNGMIPHIRYLEDETRYSPNSGAWGTPSPKKTSGITQPVITYIVLERVLQLLEKNQTKEASTKLFEYLTKNAKKVENSINFFESRLVDGLVVNVHPWETGIDNSPAYDSEVDRALYKFAQLENAIGKRKDTNNIPYEERPKQRDYEAYGKIMSALKKKKYENTAIIREKIVCFTDVFYNVLLVESIRSLEKIFNEKLKLFTSADEFQKNIEDKLFDNEKKEYILKSSDREKIFTDSFHKISPLILRKKTKDETRLVDILNKNFLIPNNGVLTVTSKSSNFDRKRYWRGPVWPVTNWLFWLGLRKSNPEIANEIKVSTLKIIAQGIDQKSVAEQAKSLLAYNNITKGVTIPSKTQYQHGWYWDSAISLLGWVNVAHAPNQDIWYEYDKLINHLPESFSRREKINAASSKLQLCTFDEYYEPSIDSKTTPNPLGSDCMSWTAAIFLDMYYDQP